MSCVGELNAQSEKLKKNVNEENSRQEYVDLIKELKNLTCLNP